MAFPEHLLAQRNKLQHEILALESTLGNGSDIAALLSSDSDSGKSDPFPLKRQNGVYLIAVSCNVSLICSFFPLAAEESDDSGHAGKDDVRTVMSMISLVMMCCSSAHV